MRKHLPQVWTRVYEALAAKFYPGEDLPDANPCDDWAPYESIRDWAIDTYGTCPVTLADQLEIIEELETNFELGDVSGMHSVSFYNVDQAYGGPEEGGWYFQYGIPSTEKELLSQKKFFPAFFNRQFVVLEPSQDARTYLTKLQAQLEALNEGLPEISSVLSRGQYAAHIDEGYPRPYPELKPRYE